MIFSCLIVFDVFEAFMDLSVRAYAINVDLNIASKKKSLPEAFARKEKEPCGFCDEKIG